MPPLILVLPGYLNDFYHFSPTALVWVQINETNVRDTRPSARGDFGFCSINETLFVLGGSNQNICTFNHNFMLNVH